MDDTRATLLLTRPEPQSRAFLADCETVLNRRLPVVISPLLQIEPVGELPDLDRFQTVILTSGNGVERLGPALGGRRVLTVGERTADLARVQGAAAHSLGENVEAFLKSATEVKTPAIHCRGVHTRGGLADRLNGVDEAILYDQVAVPLSKAAQRLLTGDAPVVVPLFSPRTAKLLSSTQVSAPVIVLAISDATAGEWMAGGDIRVAERPDRHAMCAMVGAAIC